MWGGEAAASRGGTPDGGGGGGGYGGVCDGEFELEAAPLVGLGDAERALHRLAMTRERERYFEAADGGVAAAAACVYK